VAESAEPAVVASSGALPARVAAADCAAADSAGFAGPACGCVAESSAPVAAGAVLGGRSNAKTRGVYPLLGAAALVCGASFSTTVCSTATGSESSTVGASGSFDGVLCPESVAGLLGALSGAAALSAAAALPGPSGVLGDSPLPGDSGRRGDSGLLEDSDALGDSALLGAAALLGTSGWLGAAALPGASGSLEAAALSGTPGSLGAAALPGTLGSLEAAALPGMSGRLGAAGVAGDSGSPGVSGVLDGVAWAEDSGLLGVPTGTSASAPVLLGALSGAAGAVAGGTTGGRGSWGDSDCSGGVTGWAFSGDLGAG
jgi:hypothetical protein